MKNTPNLASFVFTELHLGQITSGKWVGTQNWKHPNMDIKFSKSQNNL